MDLKQNLKRASYFFKWLFFAVILGVVLGFVGVAFHYSIEYLSRIRLENQWVIYFLPISGLLIVWLYDISKMKDDKGTNLILASIRTDEKISIKTAPLIFVSTVLTHFFGGSAGREGAALLLGASIADKTARLIKINNRDKKIITICGMSAAFAAVFGTPVSGAVFSMEVISVGIMYYAAIVPCMTASAIAYIISSSLGVKPMAAEILGIPSLNVVDVIRVALLGLLCAALAWLFCTALHGGVTIYKKLFANQYIRIAVGGVLVIILTKLVGNMDYNGAGTSVIQNALGGQANWFSFILKIIFTVLTIGAGYRGGEIVPTFFIGATFGCSVGLLLGLNPSFAAALAMVGVFCGVTNCPLTSILISVELFGGKGLIYFAIVSAICYMLSGYTGLYSEQKIVYSKFKPLFIDRKLD